MPKRKRRKWNTELLKKELKIYCDKCGVSYDLSEVIYNGMKNSVKIKCYVENHGEFNVKPTYIFNRKIQTFNERSSGICPKCNPTIKTTEELKKELKTHYDKLGFNYDLSEVIFINMNRKVKIKCDVEGHDIFKRTPTNILRRTKNCGVKECPKCSKTYRLSTQELKQKLKEHYDKLNLNYNLSEVIFNNMKTPITLICNINNHGKFYFTPSLILTEGNIFYNIYFYLV